MGSRWLRLLVKKTRNNTWVSRPADNAEARKLTVDSVNAAAIAVLWRSWASLLATCLLAVCILCCNFGAGLTTHPQVVLDASFTPAEVEGILDGLDSWHRAVPEITFSTASLGHAEIIGAALGRDYGDTIYIVRNEGVYDNCPGWRRVIGEGAAAREFSHLDQAIICIDATYLNDHEGKWKQVTMHEVGHALHLPHMPAPSVMAVPYGNIADEPSPSDIAALKGYWNLR